MARNNDGLEFNDIRLVQFSRVYLDTVVVASATKLIGERVVKYARDELQKQDRNDSGRLSKSIKSNVEFTALGPRVTVYSPLDYALWVEQGTGIFGPHRSPIVPQEARVLRFNPSRKSTAQGRRGVFNAPKTGRFTSAYVYSPSVQGQPPSRFLTNALKRLKITDFL